MEHQHSLDYEKLSLMINSLLACLKSPNVIIDKSAIKNCWELLNLIMNGNVFVMQSLKLLELHQLKLGRSLDLKIWERRLNM